MCVVCVQFEAGKLTRFEAYNALTEMITTETIEPDHVEEVYEMLWIEGE